MKGPFLSPKDQETALCFIKRKLNFKVVQKFLRRHGFQSGISLLEALVALTLLAFVLLTCVLVRFTTSKTDLARVDELSASAILRQGCMDFQAGMITNDFDDKASTNMVESGAFYVLSGRISNNVSLEIQRIYLQVGIKDSTGNSRVDAYRSRCKYLSPTRVSWPEPDTYVTPSYLTLRVYSTNAAQGLVKIDGIVTDATNDVTITNVYGSMLTIIAERKTGANFDHWQYSDNRIGTNNIYSQTNVILLDEDREIQAVFK